MNKGWRVDFVICRHVNFRNHTSQSFQTLLFGWLDHTCRYNQSPLDGNQLLLSCAAPVQTSSQDCAAAFFKLHFWQELSSHILPSQHASSSPVSQSGFIPLFSLCALVQVSCSRGRAQSPVKGWGCLWEGGGKKGTVGRVGGEKPEEFIGLWPLNDKLGKYVHFILSGALRMSRGREHVGGKNCFSYCFMVLLWQFMQMSALEGVSCTPSMPRTLETTLQNMF